MSRQSSAGLEPLLTFAEVAAIFRTSVWTVGRWRKAGRLPNATKPGKKWLVPQSDVDALLSPAAAPSATA